MDYGGETPEILPVGVAAPAGGVGRACVGKAHPVRLATLRGSEEGRLPFCATGRGGYRGGALSRGRDLPAAGEGAVAELLRGFPTASGGRGGTDARGRA